MKMRLLEDIDPDDLKTMPYAVPRPQDPRGETILKLRAECFRRRVREMVDAGVPDALVRWRDRMARSFGPVVRVWQNECGWLEALMVVRYGEDPMQWPPAFDDADVKRAEAWWRGQTPRAITYLEVDAEAGTALVGAVAGGWLIGLARPRLPRWLQGVRKIFSALTNYLENELTDHLFRARAFTAPTELHFGLFTAAPGEAGGGTEVAGGSYARAQLDPGFANWLGTNGETTDVDSAGTGGATENRNAITFPTPSANWGAISHVMAFDASTSGNPLAYAALTAPKNVNDGDPAPSFPAGSFVFTLA